LTPQQELKWLHEALGNVAASAERDLPEDDAAEVEGAWRAWRAGCSAPFFLS
jgi:hypothetical protein